MTKLTKKQESLLNELLADFKGDTEAVMGQDGLMMQLRKRVVETMLEGEMTSHLGYEPHDPLGNGSGNSRNGRFSKRVHSKDGELELEIPRDRNGSFEPQVGKTNRDFPPVTPGEILEEEFLKPMGLSQYRLAKEIHVPARRINEIVKGKRAITADTALRLGRYFGTTAQLWVNLQSTYELECTAEDLQPELIKIEPHAA